MKTLVSLAALLCSVPAFAQRPPLHGVAMRLPETRVVQRVYPNRASHILEGAIRDAAKMLRTNYTTGYGWQPKAERTAPSVRFLGVLPASQRTSHGPADLVFHIDAPKMGGSKIFVQHTFVEKGTHAVSAERMWTDVTP